MWGFADRLAKSVADVTLGTVIVLVHVALADRQSIRARRVALAPLHDETIDHRKIWKSQISP